MLPASLLVIALATQTDAPGAGSGLLAAAAGGGRPRECASARRGLARGPSVWEIARVPNLQRYCDLVARAQAQLASAPEEARATARLADEALPGRASPAVVRARASLALGDPAEAARAFAEARAIDPRSLEEPATMHDLARAHASTGKRDEALAVYRALVPRVDLLPTADRRVAVLLEAAHASMESEGRATSGKAGEAARLEEAVAYLREARQRPPTQYAGDVLLSLGLALDRAGQHDQAEAVLADVARTGARPGGAGAAAAGPRAALDYLAAPEDRLALEALAAEGSDRAAAIKAWEAFLAGPGGKGAWAAAARARLDQLRKGGGKPASAKPAKAPAARSSTAKKGSGR